MIEKQLLSETVQSAYREIVPDPSVDATFLMTKLAGKLFERGVRVVIGSAAPPIFKTIHHSLSPSHRIIWTGKEWNQALGYRATAVVGRHISDFITPDSLTFVREVAWPKFLRDGVVENVPITWVSYHGVQFPGVLKSEILRDTDGSFLRTFAKSRVRLPLQSA